MKTRKQAELQRRKEVKKIVRRYFENEGIDSFNWDLYGSKIIKKELFHTYKYIIVSWDTLLQQFVILNTHGNYILAK